MTSPIQNSVIGRVKAFGHWCVFEPKMRPQRGNKKPFDAHHCIESGQQRLEFGI
jgi:hypothetical protein